MNQWHRCIKRFSRYRHNLKLQKDVLYFMRESGLLTPVVTFNAVVEMSLVLHYQLGHPGRQKLLESVLTQGWHPALTECVSDITRTCEQCQLVKVSSCAKPPITKIKTSTPFELLCIDLLKLPRSKGGDCYLLVTVDHFTKWISVAALSSKTTKAVTTAMRNRILPSLPRLPIRVLSDNGLEFVSHEFKELLTTYGIKHTLSTPYKPSSNGLVERMNRTLLEMLRNLSSDGGNWIDDLSRVVILYNNSYHSELKATPSSLLLSVAHDIVPKPVISFDEVEYWREGNPSFASFHTGQSVLRKVVFQGNLVVDKLNDRFTGPYKVIRRNANGVTYLIENCKTGQRQRAHHTQLKRFYFPPPYLKSHPCYRRLVLCKTDILHSTSLR